MKKWIFIIFAINLVARLVLINWHPATYTDSILYMGALDQVRGTIILPAYPFAIILLRRVFSDPVLSGRLVSILTAALAVFPLYGLTRIIYRRRAALFTILLYSVSPLIFRWSLRIFPHSLYALFVLLFLYGIFKYMESERAIYLAGGIFMGGLAVLTYPTGLVLVPVAVVALVGYFAGIEYREKRIKFTLIVFISGSIILAIACFMVSPFRNLIETSLTQVLSFFPVKLPPELLLWQLIFIWGVWLFLSLLIAFFLPGTVRKPGWWYRRPSVFLLLILSFGSFVFLHIWQHYLARSTWYQKGMLTSYQSLAGRWESWLTHYLYSYPYVLVYPVALAALLGLIMTIVKSRRLLRRWIWLAFFGYFLVGTFYALVVNKWWTPRYQYTLVVLALVPAGYGLSWLWGWKKIKWLGKSALFLCLFGSLIFTAFTIYWSRDSFADISRSSLYLKDHYLDRRIFTDELQKVGFWAKRPLRGYTRRSSSTMRKEDILILHGWHTNLRTEYDYLSRLYEMGVLKKFPVDLVPLMADDIVDWAGKRLRRRANAPVVWEERFEKQHIESWIIEIKERRDGEEDYIPPVSGNQEIGPALPGIEYADYFDIGVWEVQRKVKNGTVVVLEIAHARGGPAGAFRMEVFSDTDGDGIPDKRVERSPRFEKEKEGAWSRWEFIAPGGKIFVGSSWELGTWVYHIKPPGPAGELGEVMYYSRGGPPSHKADRIGKVKITFPGEKIGAGNSPEL